MSHTQVWTKLCFTRPSLQLEENIQVTQNYFPRYKTSVIETFPFIIYVHKINQLSWDMTDTWICNNAGYKQKGKTNKGHPYLKSSFSPKVEQSLFNVHPPIKVSAWHHYFKHQLRCFFTPIVQIAIIPQLALIFPTFRQSAGLHQVFKRLEASPTLVSGWAHGHHLNQNSIDLLTRQRTQHNWGLQGYQCVNTSFRDPGLDFLSTQTRLSAIYLQKKPDTVCVWIIP